MRLTFIHDHKFLSNGRHYFSSGKFSKEIMRRYLVGEVDEIQFIGRVQKTNPEISSMSQADDQNIIINPMKFLTSKLDFILKRKEIKFFLKNNIRSTDIVIIRMPSHIGYIAAEYLQGEKIPYGIELVGDPWDALWHHGSFIGKILAYDTRRKVKKYIKNSKNNMYVTKSYLQNKYPSEGNQFSASNVLINEIQKKYSNDSNEIKKIGMIGSLDTRYKGIDTALKSLSRVKSNYRFEIVGNGPKEKWQKKINEFSLNEKVELKGTLKSGAEMDKWFSSLDLYIQPSYTEGLPRALIEAMSKGIPALGSNAGGIPELLNNQYIHTPKDYKTLANQITEVLENKDLRNKMSEENLKASVEYLNENIQKERERFIKSIYMERDKL